jgi:endonuclease/exonuclease/phosphatase family metal-dependent hydrolase
MSSVVESLPVVVASERDRILAGPMDRVTHELHFSRLPFADGVERQLPPTPRPPADALRVVAWNAERCRRPDAAAALLRRARADVALLTEMDVGMARTGQAHTPREVAAALRAGYAFAVEFLELGLGSERERARHAGEANTVGYHGGALISAHAPERPEVVRLETRGDWFGAERGERRVGGRMALLASLGLGGRMLTIAAVHLESHGDPEERAAELQVLLEAIEARAPGGPALIDGDLNTSSLGRAELDDPDRLKRALVADPRRLGAPFAYEPLFPAAAAAGYQWETCNAARESSQRVATPEGSARGALRLDWLLARGLLCESPEVVAAADPDTGAALSDHEALAVTVRVA